MTSSLHEEVVDATGRSLGRVAVLVAYLLRGKGRPDFDPSRIPNLRVVVKNARRLRFTGRKLAKRTIYRFSGYPGGMKSSTLRREFERSPEPVVRHAIRNMLPKNRLRKRLLAHLQIHS